MQTSRENGIKAESKTVTRGYRNIIDMDDIT